MLWSFSPFVTAQKRFYTAVLFSRLLMVLVSKWLQRHIATPLPHKLWHLQSVHAYSLHNSVLRYPDITLIVFLSMR